MVCQVGDATTNIGAWYESLNLAALFVLWLAGRVGFLVPGLPPVWVAAVDFAFRRQGWAAPVPRYRRGVMAKYARLVQSASEGAVTR